MAESFAQDRAVHGYEHKIDDKLLKPMVHYRRDTKVRWPVLKQVEVTVTITDALAFSGSRESSLSIVCCRILRCSGGTQHARRSMELLR